MLRNFILLLIFTLTLNAFSIIDVNGKKIDLENLPFKRAIFTTYTENISALRVWDKIVGINEFAYTNSIALKTNPNLIKIPSVGKHSDLNMEKIISLKPDVVFAWANKQEIADFIEKRGIKVIAFKPLTIEDIYDDLLIQGKILGVENRAKFVVLKMKEIFAYIYEKTKNIENKKRVTWTWANPTIITSNGSVIFDILSKLNVINPFDNIKTPYANIGLEGLIKANPDIIFIWDGARYDESALLENKQLKHINAIKNSKVIKAPDWNSWGPRSALIGLWMANYIYPEYFSKSDTMNLIKEFNKDVFGIE
ncbi:ABC transporter substrate-binding protein [Campylobacter sputorum]|uniref:ABC transporter substrate-binding protein n=1 Tax=Campylobacter sputorum TaxID=206 RepID=UPI00053BDCB6|nr:ABC transporter substrate-binding protein [Campylobacter sputorum]